MRLWVRVRWKVDIWRQIRRSINIRAHRRRARSARSTTRKCCLNASTSTPYTNFGDDLHRTQSFTSPHSFPLHLLNSQGCQRVLNSRIAKGVSSWLPILSYFLSYAFSLFFFASLNFLLPLHYLLLHLRIHMAANVGPCFWHFIVTLGFGTQYGLSTKFDIRPRPFSN